MSGFRQFPRAFDTSSAGDVCTVCYNDSVMTVYAEQIIFDNLCVDGVLLYAVFRVLGAATSGRRIFAAAGLGSLAALAAAVFGGWVAPVLGIVTAPLTVWIAGRKYTAHKYALCLGLFLALTAVMGGVCYALLGAIGFERMRRLPVGLVALAAGGVSVASARLAAAVRGGNVRKGYIYAVRAMIGGHAIEAQAYLDSGNCVVEPVSGLPVILFDVSLFRGLGDGIELDLLRGRAPYGAGGVWIPYATQSGTGKIFAFRPDSFVIYSETGENTIYDVMIGTDLVRPIDGCKALLPPQVMTEVGL